MTRLHTGVAAVGLTLAMLSAPAFAAPAAAAPKAGAPSPAKSVVLTTLRKGPVLTLMAGGKPVARFTNDATLNWNDLGQGVMKTAAGPKPVFILSPNYRDPEDSDQARDQPTFYFDETGRLVVASEGQFNPAMNVLLDNDHETFSVGDYEASFSLEDVTRPTHLKFTFQSNCYGEQWVSDTELKALCPRTTAKGIVVETDAVVRQVSPTQWRLTEKALPKGKLEIGPRNPPTLFKELVTGVPMKPDPQTLHFEYRRTYKRY